MQEETLGPEYDTDYLYETYAKRRINFKVSEKGVAAIILDYYWEEVVAIVNGRTKKDAFEKAKRWLDKNVKSKRRYAKRWPKGIPPLYCSSCDKKHTYLGKKGKKHVFYCTNCDDEYILGKEDLLEINDG